MTRLIDADALIQIFEADEKALADREFQLAAIGAANTVRKMPTVDALPYEYIENLEKELRQKVNESESQERKEFYLQSAEAIQRLLITWEVKGRGTVRGYDQTD